MVAAVTEHQRTEEFHLLTDRGQLVSRRMRFLTLLSSLRTFRRIILYTYLSYAFYKFHLFVTRQPGTALSGLKDDKELSKKAVEALINNIPTPANRTCPLHELDL